MSLALAMVTMVVPDYDEAIAYFTQSLGFVLIEDTCLGEGKRWVVVAPALGARLLLAKASTPDQIAAVGRQTGGRVGFFLHTTNFDQTVAAYRAAGVKFTESARTEFYGQVIVFADRYGNRWDLIEPAERQAA